MSVLERLKDKMMGRMSPEEEEIRRRADIRAAEYESATGEMAPEEPGIEAIPVEEAVGLITPVGAIKSGAKEAAKKAAKGGILARLKEMFPGEDKKTASPLSTKDAELRREALKSGEVLQEVKRVGPEAAEKAMAAERRARQEEIRRLQAARDRTGPAGSLTSADKNPPVDYIKLRPTQKEPGPELDPSLFKRGPETKPPSDTVIIYRDGKAIGSRKRRPGEE